MRRQVLVLTTAAVFALLGVVWAGGLDEASLIGRVTAADHEIAEGYFSMGEEATIVAKPGSELHRWLSAHRGEKVRLAITSSREDVPSQMPQRPNDERTSGSSSRFPPAAHR
jgi:hypothetical protein